jgi:3-phenylpropionate/trans-cinnamate dioxygenase ferredoxin subunit
MKQKICKLDELISGMARRFEVADRAIAVVRIDNQVYAIGDKCSHADVALSDGEVLCDTIEIECIRHASSFSLETGKPNTLPATQPVPVYVATVENGDVFIELK